VGTDLGPSLVKTLRKLGPEGLTKEELLHAIDAWEAERLAKSKAKGAIADKADCLRVFASFGATLGGAVAYCEHIFADRGAISLLSGHKSKGLEWNVVYHLDPWRIPSPYAIDHEAREQEKNIDYVISTRAKEELYLIDMERIEV
jgi:superfamily I DNA/RNA helicase